MIYLERCDKLMTRITYTTMKGDADMLLKNGEEKMQEQMNEEIITTPSQIWEEVMGWWYPGMEPDEIEEELENWVRD